MFSIMKSSKWCFLISAAIILIGAVSLIINGGFATDIDFAGGGKMVIETAGAKDISEGTIKKAVESCDVDFYSTVKEDGGKRIQIKTEEIKNDKRVEVFAAVKAATGIKADDYVSCETISATLSKNLLSNALIALVVAVALILVYIYIRFEFAAGVAAVLALLHDSLVMLSVYAIFRFTVNSTFVAAILTIIGYSVNATIIVFDRIRENKKYVAKSDFTDICETSIRQTLRRTLNTTVTTMVALIVLYVMGAESIKAFALPLMIGVMVGTYSSVMIASPLWNFVRGTGSSKKQNSMSKKK